MEAEVVTWTSTLQGRCQRRLSHDVAGGAKELRPVETRFYGDRRGMVEDPFGHHGMIATHVEDVSPEEMQRRAAQAAGSPG